MTSHNTVSDYIAVLRRRKFQFLVPFLLVLVVSIGVAFGLSPLYRSTARILVEQQEIPPELVSSTVSSYASERIATISQYVMTFDKLKEIAQEAGLLGPNANYDTQVDIVKRIRENIHVEPVSAEVFDPRSGRPQVVTIAFDISVDSHSPESARTIARQLVDRYLNINKEIRTQKAEASTQFLTDESERLSRVISKLEADLAEFKEHNVGRLPGMMDLNMNLLERKEREYEEVEKRIQELEEKRVTLVSQLSQIDPYAEGSPAARLKELQRELFSNLAKYEPTHPDIVQLKREIAVLEKEIGQSGTSQELLKRLQLSQDELAKARTRYSEEHPDVIRLTNEVARLEEALKEQAGTARQAGKIQADNPAYISIQAQLDTVDIQLSSEKVKQARIKTKLDELEQRIQQMPQIEQQALKLQRDYENAVRKYQEIKDKQLQAQIASQLEKEGKGEHFTLIDPPQLAHKPYRPNRPAILFLGVVLSFASGLSLVAGAEYLDANVRGIKGLRAVFPTPPLAVVPYIENKHDQRHQQRRIRFQQLFLLGLSIAFLLSIIYSYWDPSGAGEGTQSQVHASQ